METTLLNWLQLCSPALPVGAYSYSEGIETLVDQGVITSAEDLEAWLGQELQTGTIRIDAAIAYRAWQFYTDWPTLNSWNSWLTALWETKELREQSWQMGESLSLLLPQLESSLDFAPLTKPINFAITFGIGGKVMGISAELLTLGYVQSWTANLITAGVRLVPLGQTAGQKILWNLKSAIANCADTARTLPDDRLESCSWGQTLASAAHETLYTRLFRS